MARLRAAEGPLPVAALTDAVPDPVQLDRVLTGLVADGLASLGPAGYALPG